MAPKITITGPDQIVRGQSALFSAVTSDPDGDPVTLRWAVVDTQCPGDLGPSQWPADRRSSDQRLQVAAPDTNARFCVWGFATDSLGAIGVAAMEGDPVPPVNHPPVARIDLVSPSAAASYPLYSTFDLTSSGSTDADGDVLTVSWTLTAPSASALSLVPSSGRTGPALSFTADVPGEYDVVLKVSDGAPTPGAPFELKLLVLDDQVPCLGDTLPKADFSAGGMLVHNPAQDHTFQVVTVVDDGDPWPRSMVTHSATTFAWYVGLDTGPFSYVGDSWEYVVRADTFSIGDNARVRLEISDRDTQRADKLRLSCSPADAPVCAASPGCLQRVTWDVAYR